MNQILLAQAFATGAHCGIGQMRKYSTDHYIEHPRRVASMVGMWGAPEYIEAAAWLHDVLEDTKVESHQIGAIFGNKTVQVVEALSNVPPTAGLNREMRKSMDRQRLRESCGWTQAIKCADIIDNAASIARKDKEFALLYITECRKLLEVMIKVNGDIIEKTRKVLNDAEYEARALPDPNVMLL